ncbi:hypothetical protein BDV98DRAFT_596114 [Pterulicium gracile]|uniref:Protein-S-isoprenylcysteine O-methyltransferase n=1 Tax=Pterulicium gracile TaxID=1884261 RepID=A0A5C3QA97_9AGAR|nr:hypothetical protein BDV98DRAFT_596114 [Pterula gracilis]
MDRSQSVELIVIASTAFFSLFSISRIKSIAPRALAEAGKLHSLFKTALGKIISPVHGLTTFVPLLVYLVVVPMCRLRQPGWMLWYSLPTLTTIRGFKFDSPEEMKGAVRITASVMMCCLAWVNIWIMDVFLGSQWAAIGVREKPTIINTGPYAVVRHPIYSIMLLVEICFGLMFWSYVPLIGGTIVAICFAVKMPIEEGLIEDDPKVGQAYREYRKQVPARIVPLLW